MAVDDSHVLIDHDHDVVARAQRVIPGDRRARCRRVHLDARRRGEVDARVGVVRRTARIEGLEIEVRAAERLADGSSDDDGLDRQALMARHLHRGDEPEDDCSGDDREEAHQAFASAWPICVKAVCTIDSSLCEVFSAPPRAPGTLNTIKRDARANRWWTGLMPSCSRAKPIESTNSCAGCMNRFVVKCDAHILARWFVSGSIKRRAANGAVIASTIRSA